MIRKDGLHVNLSEKLSRQTNDSRKGNPLHSNHLLLGRANRKRALTGDP
jgi:hypothetical protein